MIHIPPQTYIEQTLKVGTVYKMAAPELIGTEIPHYFVIVGIDEEDNYSVLSTTQLDKKVAYFEKAGLDFCTLVHVSNSTQNGLTTDSYFNCNDPYPMSKDYLISKVNSGDIELSGEVSYADYEKIREGIKQSVLNDMPKDILIHPMDNGEE